MAELPDTSPEPVPPPEQSELFLHSFQVKPGLEEAFAQALADAKGMKRLAFEKAIRWVEKIQTRMQAGVLMQEAASASFPEIYKDGDVGKITAPGARLIAQFWAEDAAPVLAEIEQQVKVRNMGGMPVMGGIKDPRCKYVDDRDQARPAPQGGSLKR